MENKKTGWIPCPGDTANQKIQGMALCRDCRKQFDRDVGDAVLEGKTPPTYEAWIERRVSGLMPELEKALQNASAALSAAKVQSEEYLNEMLNAAVAGRTLSIEQLRAAKERLRETRGKEVWEGLEGNKVFRQERVAEGRLTEARRLLKDLEAKKPAPPTPAPDDEPAAPKSPKKAKGAKKSTGTRAKKTREAREREASEIE